MKRICTSVGCSILALLKFKNARMKVRFSVLVALGSSEKSVPPGPGNTRISFNDIITYDKLVGGFTVSSYLKIIIRYRDVTFKFGRSSLFESQNLNRNSMFCK